MEAAAGNDQTLEPVKGRFARHKRLWWAIGALTAVAVAAILAVSVSPRPGAALIRVVFERNAAETKSAMEAYAPTGVATITDQPYRPGDEDARLDVYFPATLAAAAAPSNLLPTVVWVHGGAWISGSKRDAVPYFQIIAAAGYTVVALDYSVAPAKTYPTPVVQVNAALAYLQANADRFHIDRDRIVLAGDSAGAQIVAQIATLVTNPAYATGLGITPTLAPAQLRGVVLFCGIYDMAAFTQRGDLPGGDTFIARVLDWGVRTVVWAYTGQRGGDPTALDQMSSIDAVTAAFPPAFISGGNDDPLTVAQSQPLAAKLASLGVAVSPLFYPSDHTPKLGHEYQFKLASTDGQTALAQMLAFLNDVTIQ